MIGKVTKWDMIRAFGFIRELGEYGTEQFFHLNSVFDRRIPKIGETATFRVGPSEKTPGRTEAFDVVLQGGVIRAIEVESQLNFKEDL